jgi:hypothetical protein
MLPIVLVTSWPERLRGLFHNDHVLPPVVLRKPASGKLILDAIHSASRADPSKAAKLERPASVVAALAAKRAPPDADFDRFLPDDLRAASDVFWTPLDVVTRAAEWIDQLGIKTLVDIGSGVGKFCIAGALATRCAFIGIEQRSRLVSEARSLASFFGVQKRVTFMEGRFSPITTPTADCYYLFNPFWENMFQRQDWLDQEIELGPERYRQDLRAAKVLFRSLPIGSYVLTYNGIGTHLPDEFEEVLVDRARPGGLQLTRKVFARARTTWL